MVAPEERLLFSASPDQNGPTLQVTDGTTAGTAVLDTFKDPREFVTFNGSVFLTAKTAQSDTETNLWSWSPSTGRQLIEPRVEGQLAAVASTLFIAKRSGSTLAGRLKQELWTTDGVQDAATPLSTLWPNGDAAVSELTTVGTTVFFAACDPKVGRGLYKTDGTTVTLVKDFLTAGDGFATGPSNSCDTANGPNQLTEIHGRLYFVVDDGVHGLELWTSDGTAGGTRMVQDLNQDPSAPVAFRPAEPSDPALNLESCGRAKCRVVTSNGFFFTAQTLADGARALVLRRDDDDDRPGRRSPPGASERRHLGLPRAAREPDRLRRRRRLRELGAMGARARAGRFPRTLRGRGAARRPCRDGFGRGEPLD